VSYYDNDVDEGKTIMRQQVLDMLSEELELYPDRSERANPRSVILRIIANVEKM